MVRSGHTVPPVYHDVLPRREVTRLINDTSLHTAVYMVAPFGFGKTMAVKAWLNSRSSESTVCWLNWTAADNSASALTARFSAVLSVSPQDGRAGSLEELLAKMSARVPRNGQENILIFDHFEHINDTEALSLCKDIIVECLGMWRVIIMGRVDLSPIFNDLMLKGYIRLITPRELRFSPQETADYFTMNGYEAAWPAIERLHNDTDGWPAALNAVLTVSRGGSAVYGETARAYIMRFFETEIWSDLSEKVRDFLLKTAILETLTPPSCRIISDREPALPIIEWLLANGIFITRLDERNTFQYHRLFRDFLLEKLNTSDFDAKDLYKRFAWWLYDKGDHKQSFTYFFKAGEYYGLNQVLKIINPANMEMEEFLSLTDCLNTLDVNALRAYPLIIAKMALISFLMGDIDKMHRLYRTYLDCIEPGNLFVSADHYSEYVWESGWMCYIDPDEEPLNNEKHIEWTNYKEYVPHLQTQHRARGAVLRSFPSVLRGIRDYSSTVPHVDAFLLKAAETGQSPVREEVSLWEMEIMRAEYAYEQEDFSRALEIIRRVMARVEAAQMTDLYFACVALLAKLMRVLNTPGEMSALIDRLRNMIMERNETYILPNFRAFLQINSLADGSQGLAPEFEQENTPLLYKPYYYLRYRHTAYTRALLSMGRNNEALLVLGNLDLLYQKYGRVIDRIEISILTVAAHMQAGHESTAVSYWSEALESAKRLGYIRIIADDAKLIWPLLEHYKNGSDPFLKRILYSCKKTLKQAGYLENPKRAQIGLTKKELRILQSLQTGLSYDEIALEYGIRLSTVKSHVHSVYSKLGVDNRTSAVIAAQESGLL